MASQNRNPKNNKVSNVGSSTKDKQIRWRDLEGEVIYVDDDKAPLNKPASNETTPTAPVPVSSDCNHDCGDYEGILCCQKKLGNDKDGHNRYEYRQYKNRCRLNEYNYCTNRKECRFFQFSTIIYLNNY